MAEQKKNEAMNASNAAMNDGGPPDHHGIPKQTVSPFDTCDANLGCTQVHIICAKNLKCHDIIDPSFMNVSMISALRSMAFQTFGTYVIDLVHSIQTDTTTSD